MGACGTVSPENFTLAEEAHENTRLASSCLWYFGDTFLSRVDALDASGVSDYLVGTIQSKKN